MSALIPGLLAAAGIVGVTVMWPEPISKKQPPTPAISTPTRSSATEQSGSVEREAARNTAADRAWPQWRGPLATGYAPHADPPITWSENKNIRWKIALPGKGHSTPAVWNHRVFVTTAVPFGETVEPIHSDAPTARSIHSLVEIGHTIRPEHFKAVAAAIVFADRMRAEERQRTGAAT